MTSPFPEELRALPQWLVWRNEQVGNRATKIPYQTNGTKAKVNDPTTWTTFDEALKQYQSGEGNYSGIGFVFTPDDPYCGIDLDGCRDPATGNTQAWAVEILNQVGSYCEVSPSLSGWKIIGKAKSPMLTGRNRKLDGEINGKQAGIEIYDRGRWFALTGRRGKYKEIIECQESVNAVCREHFAPSAPPRPTYRPQVSSDLLERARRYVAKLDPSISGNGGHNAAFRAACVLVLGFGLSPDEAYPVFCEYNQRCEPPWSDKEIWHKLQDASKQPGERNYLRDAQESEWTKITVPSYGYTPKPVKATPTIREFVTVQQAALKYLDACERNEPLIDLGITELNDAVGGGVERGEMVILAARPSHGKSAFAMQCLHQCAKAGMPCLMVSEEMSALALGRRALQYISGVPQNLWQRDRHIVERHVEFYTSGRASIHIVESCRTCDAVALAVKKAVDDHGVQVVAVDYAQMLVGAGRGRYEQISNTSLALRQIANDHNVLLLTLCQLNRGVENRDKFVPRMTDLRDSGQLEQDADVIMFLVWPYQIAKDTAKDEYQVFVGKNRNRPINQSLVVCQFEPSRQKFAGVDRTHADFREYALDAKEF